MQDEIHRLHCTLRMGAEYQRRAWEIISAFPKGQRTDRICRTICGYMDQQELLKAVKETIRNEIITGGFSPPENKQIEQAGVIGEEVLGFLLSLQNEGSDDTDSIP